MHRIIAKKNKTSELFKSGSASLYWIQLFSIGLSCVWLIFILFLAFVHLYCILLKPLHFFYICMILQPNFIYNSELPSAINSSFFWVTLPPILFF
ncbi:hypothetical protein GDO78_006460 [Eleutherodactylus coqui]|uniref:Uncharacterized protein n=1 Tax=Eleutherodactylus coqui TaxID=57060 RepID=A0A8J6KGV0_ELECQ|nr:hypothetical protein GDO78_006460 [Eleutherodactylus coqui]